MKTTQDVPLSGYSISSVRSVRQTLEPRETPVDPSDSSAITFGWDWRLKAESDEHFEVLIRVKAESGQESPYSACVELVGEFRKVTEKPSVAVDDFASLQAVAILLPYARAHLATLTLHSAGGSYHLPSVNVVALMKDFNAKEATGAKQLADREAQRDALESLPGSDTLH